jgi:type VI secretion system secreted protein Hcp
MAGYLQYGAIKKGESLAEGHKGDDGWMEVESVQFGTGRTITSPVGSSSKREATAAGVSEITLTKLMDSTSPLLFQEALVGKAVKAKINLIETGTKQLFPYLQVTLTNAMISGYSVTSDGDRPKESITVNFTQIEYKYTPQDDTSLTGTPVPVTYDLPSATKK